MAFLDWLLSPVFFPILRSPQTQVELKRVRQEISRLEQLMGYYINRAVAELRKEERLIVSDRAYRTYQSPYGTPLGGHA